jgi:PAS domain S-box-containing protein
MRPTLLVLARDPERQARLATWLADLGARVQTQLAERVDVAAVVLAAQDPSALDEVPRLRRNGVRAPVLAVVPPDLLYADAVLAALERGAIDVVPDDLPPPALRAKVRLLIELDRRVRHVAREATRLREAQEKSHQRLLKETAAAERQRVEEAVRRMNEREALLLRSAPVAIYASTPPPELRPISVTPNVQRIMGFAPETFSRARGFWSSRIHPDDRDRVLIEFCALPTTGEVSVEYRWLCADGTWRWFLDQAVLLRAPDGVPVEVAGTWLNIHDRRCAEHSLREAHRILEERMRERMLEEERLKVTLRSIADGVIATDTAGRIRLMSRVAEDLTGWSQARALGAPLIDVVPIQDERTGRRADPSLLDALSRPIPETDAVLVRADGSERLVRYGASPIRSTDGAAYGLVLVFRDIADRRRHEEELLKASKLESIGVLAGGIAHDFNNLLTGILASVSVAILQERRGQPVGDRLRAAQLACERARTLTQQLLTFARGGEPVKTRVDLERLVRDAATFALQGSRSRCEFEVIGPLNAIEADPGQIGQVVHNLALNADQAMPAGGTLRIRMENVSLEANASRRTPAGAYVAVHFRDTGVGIPAEHRAKIFDPFFTTKPGGSGLGLATVYSILQRHEGQVDVVSRPNNGTTFTIYLPALTSIAEAEATDEIVSLTGGDGRVLVMDDEQSVLDVAREALSELGYEVTTARDGEEAISRYREALAAMRRFDVVVMDLTIPGAMGGLDAVRQLLDIDPEVRAIVSSGYSNDPVLANPEGFGFRGVLAKPWRIDDLDAALRRALEVDRSPRRTPA